MRNLYIIKVFLLMLLLGSSIDNVFSQDQYVSTETGGEFNVDSSWIGGKVPSETNWTITIVPNSVITYNGIFSWGQKVTINGDFRVNGKFTGGYGGVAIGADASVTVNGAFKASGSLQVGDRAKVNVIGDFDMGGGTTANIKGDLNIEGNLIASGSKFIIHDGVTVTVNGNVDANVPIEVKDGGTLIVNGDYKNGQSLIVQANGLVKVSGEYNSNGDLKNSGVLLVTGNYINNSGGDGISVLGKGLLDIGGDLVANKAVNVESEAVLIVRGSLNYEGGQSGVVIKGTLIVKEDFNIKNGNISSTGKVVVGGTFKFDNGGFTSPEGSENLYLLDPEAPHSYINGGKDFIKSNTGNADDFIANEGDNLKDLVDSVMPDTVSPKYKWVGSKNSVWTNVENWNGRVPGPKSNVIIENKGHNPEILSGYGLVELNGLTIEPGAVLTLKPGAKLTVNGGLDIKQEGGLLLENKTESNGLASLITHGTVTGEVEVNLTLLNKRWYYLSSPMKEVDYTHFGSEEDAQVYVYRNNKWVQYLDANLSNPVYLEGATVGFGSPEPTTTIRYSGKINTEPVPRVLKTRGYHLFGNPYSASINWETISSAHSEIYPSMWYRTKIINDMAYITYNSNGPVGGKATLYPDDDKWGDDTDLALIPPFQSVWIYSRTASASNPITVSVAPSQRVHGSVSSTLKSGKKKDRADVLRVMVENENSRDGAVIYFSENATDGFDPGDSQKYFNDSKLIPEVYTRSAGQSIAINGLAPLEGSLDLPMSVRNRVAGPVDLNFDLSYYRSDDVILLHDTYLDVEINLRKVKQYRYEPFNLGDSHDRFVIRFNPEGYEDDNVSTPVDEKAVGNSDHLINITGVNGRAIVSIDRALLQDASGKIEVFNVAGAKISEFKASTNKTFIVLPEAPGVYLVVVKAGGKMKSKKLVK